MLIILNLLADLERPMYGYEIIQELESRSQAYLRFKEGLIYPHLHELERQGMLRAEWKGEEGSSRKHLTITSADRHRLEKELKGWQSFARNMNQLLGTKTAS